MMKVIQKFLEILYGYPIYLISFCIPKNSKKIVVGSHTPFNDNSKYFFLLSQQYLTGYEVIRITKDKNIVNPWENINIGGL